MTPYRAGDKYIVAYLPPSLERTPWLFSFKKARADGLSTDHRTEGAPSSESDCARRV